jgi:hypothetical protein
MTRKGETFTVFINDEVAARVPLTEAGAYDTVSLGLTGGDAYRGNNWVAKLYKLKIGTLSP